METVEAEWHGWQPAPYSDKAQTDANFCRMLVSLPAIPAARGPSISPSAATISLTAPWTWPCAKRAIFGSLVELEMLEGMANRRARASPGRLRPRSLRPCRPPREFLQRPDLPPAPADEIPAPENFLRDSFGLAPESESWNHQRARFVLSWQTRADAATDSRHATSLSRPRDRFQNASDTDWTQPDQRRALADALARGPVPAPAPGLSSQWNDALAALSAAQPQWEKIRP